MNLHLEGDGSKTYHRGHSDEGYDDPHHKDDDDGWQLLLSSSIYFVTRVPTWLALDNHECFDLNCLPTEYASW